MSSASRHHKRKPLSTDEGLVNGGYGLHGYKNHATTATRALRELGSPDHDTVEHNQHTSEPDQNELMPSSGRDSPMHGPESESPVFRPDSPMVETIQEDTIEVLPPHVTDKVSQYAQWSHESNGALTNSPYPDGQDAPPGPGSAVPKRKRNFSNRTKTGCWTCRERKKKCDEGRPVCYNCHRGGFRCKGYGKFPDDPSTWPSPPESDAPLPSSRDVLPASAQGLHSSPAMDDRTSSNAAMMNNDSGHMPSTQSNHATNIPRPQMATVSHPPPMQSVTHVPIEARGQPYYGTQPSWIPHQHPPSHHPEQLPRLPELSQGEGNAPSHPQATRPSVSPLQYQQGRVENAMLPPAATIPPTSASQVGSQFRHFDPLHPPRPEERTSRAPPQTEATHRRSASDSQRIPPKVFGKEDVERSKMTRSTAYEHQDQTLQRERARCKRALARYNTACDIDSGMNKEALRDLLMMVFDPSKDITYGTPSPIPMTGLLGPDVMIEAPFRCSYGYNIKIQQDVFIGENCKIDDAAEVDIGARTHIGCDVVIFTADVCTDMHDRRGYKSKSVARPVHIGPNVIIGRGAVIHPGVTLGQSCTIWPYEIIMSDVADFDNVKTGTGRARMTAQDF